MRIAIPTFATRVSPRFDCARSVLVVTIDEDGTPSRQELAAGDWLPHERVNRLLELGIDTVLCGGIDRWSAASLQTAGVTVYGWVAGEIDDALAALLEGDLDAEAAMGGGSGCVCRRFPGDEQADAELSGHGRNARGRRGGQRKRGSGHPPIW